MARRDFLRIEVSGAVSPMVGDQGRLFGPRRASDLNSSERRLQNELNKMMRTVNDKAADEARVAAPFDTGRLRNSIQSRIFFRTDTVRVTVGARAMRDGFNYFNVSRYGHIQSVITPKRGRSLKVHLWGRRQGAVPPRVAFHGPSPRPVDQMDIPAPPMVTRRLARAGALRPSTAWVLKRSVRGYKPTSDWVDYAQRNVRTMVDYYTARYNREVSVIVLESRKVRV